ncbi:hypothetical protein [Stutzerimonas sp. R75]|uniref:hypothetical protein n=1 Tax=Stutzerimonas sp. R75 TaxID=3439498 RepID=UPI00406D2565
MTPQDLLIAFQSKSTDKATAKEDYFVVSAGEVFLTQLDQSSVASLQKSGVITIQADGVDTLVYKYLKAKGIVSARDMEQASPSFKK